MLRVAAGFSSVSQLSTRPRHLFCTNRVPGPKGEDSGPHSTDPRVQGDVAALPKHAEKSCISSEIGTDVHLKNQAAQRGLGDSSEPPLMESGFGHTWRYGASPACSPEASLCRCQVTGEGRCWHGETLTSPVSDPSPFAPGTLWRWHRSKTRQRPSPGSFGGWRQLCPLIDTACISVPVALELLLTYTSVHGSHESSSCTCHASTHRHVCTPCQLTRSTGDLHHRAGAQVKAFPLLPEKCVC